MPRKRRQSERRKREENRNRIQTKRYSFSIVDKKGNLNIKNSDKYLDFF